MDSVEPGKGPEVIDLEAWEPDDNEKVREFLADNHAPNSVVLALGKLIEAHKRANEGALVGYANYCAEAFNDGDAFSFEAWLDWCISERARVRDALENR